MHLRVFLNDKDEQITSHFNSSELKCKCGKCKISLINIDHVNRLERLRQIIDAPIYINSGYRCYEHNLSIGGSSKSRHMCGDATDIRVKNMTPVELEAYVKNLFDGIGLYADFIHVDSRGQEAFWSFLD